MSKPMSLLIAAFVAGCASDTGVTPLGQGNYSIAKQQATGFPGLGNLKSDALKEAEQKCLSEGRELFVVRTTETQPPYLLGNYPRAEIEFRCVAKGAPR
jgi:hypothetical protein